MYLLNVSSLIFTLYETIFVFDYVCMSMPSFDTVCVSESPGGSERILCHGFIGPCP